MNFEKYNLKYNPFESLIPQRNNLFWAGMKSQKKIILSSYNKLIKSNPRQVVLNWGQWGGGKTHAALYFRENASVLLKKEKDYFLNAYLRIPQEGKGANKIVIQSIFDSVSFREIKSELVRVKKELGAEKLYQVINNKINSEAFADSVVLLADEIYPINILQRFVFGGLSSSELKKLKLPKSLKSDDDYTSFLAAVITAITAGKEKKRFVVWIDEMENMVYYSSNQFKVLAQMLRDLTDKVNERMLVFFNFTLAENAIETVRLLMGDALWSRVDKKNRFPNLTIQEASEYCKDAINLAQIDGRKKLSPFTVESIEIILKTIPSIELIPREINRRFNDVLHFAIEKNCQSINKDFVRDWIDSKVEDKI